MARSEGAAAWPPIVRFFPGEYGGIGVEIDLSGLPEDQFLTVWRGVRARLDGALAGWTQTVSDRDGVAWVAKVRAREYRPIAYLSYRFLGQPDLADRFEAVEQILIRNADGAMRLHTQPLLRLVLGGLSGLSPAIRTTLAYGGQTIPPAVWGWLGPPELHDRWIRLLIEVIRAESWPRSGWRARVRADPGLRATLAGAGLVV